MWNRTLLPKSLEENKQKLRCQTFDSVKRRKRRSKFRRLQINLLGDVRSIIDGEKFQHVPFSTLSDGHVGDIFCQWITLSPLLAWFPMLPHTDTYNQPRKIISTSHGLNRFWTLQYFCCVCWKDNWSDICLLEAAVPFQARFIFSLATCGW